MKIRNIFWCLVFFTAVFQTHLSAMSTQADKILNSAGEEIELKGVNWFGFNNGSTMVDGLWSSGGLASDFATVVYRMQLLGFNAIRLPFSFKDLYNLNPRNFVFNYPIPTQSQIQASVTNPSVPVPQDLTIPPMIAPPTRASTNHTNDYLPNDTTMNRFLWVVNFFAKNGFYVLIDNHLREDQTVLQNQDLWIQLWKDLVTKISQDPVSKKMLMIDILNEPDNYGIRWEANGQTPSLKDLYISAMDALYPINKEALFFVEGTGQGGIGANWGDGFATDPALITQFGLSNPKPFFDTLLTKPYLNQVVISPHVYPPSVTGATQNYKGEGLYQRLTRSFGYLTHPGYCPSACKIFPVAIGEFGSRFSEQNDIDSMQDIAKYFMDPTTDNKHNPIKNWFYWSWNANSGDTGGIVEDDWTKIVWKKIDYLVTAGLKPWYTKEIGPVKTGNLCLSIAPAEGLSKEDLKAITVANQTFAFTDFNISICKTIPTGNYTITPPPITKSTTQYSANPQIITVNEGTTTPISIIYEGTPIIVPRGDIEVSVQLGTAWKDNSQNFLNVINLYIKNNGDQNLTVPWKIDVIHNDFQSVSSYWNFSYEGISGGRIQGTVKETWETLISKGGNTVNIGMIVSSTSSNFMPSSILINGKPAIIKVK